MGIWVRVIEFSGDVVDELRASVDVGRICEAVREAADRYPVLAGVDGYDDTIFNGRQLGALIAELDTLATTTDDAVLLAAIRGSSEVGRSGHAGTAAADAPPTGVRR